MAPAVAGLWVVLCLAPVATLLARADGWEGPAWHQGALSLWLLAFACAWLPARAFLVLSFPIVVAGLGVSLADLVHSVDALELLAVLPTYRRLEVRQALAPYGFWIAAFLFLLACVAAILWRHAPSLPRAGLRTRIALAAAGPGLALVAHAGAWQQTWPVSLGAAAVDASLALDGIGRPNLPDVRANPRDRFDTWGARSDKRPDARETYVLVIGETVRADRVPGCGGRPGITPAPADAILMCDVLAGAGNTHVAVPLLISRELPGAQNRIPREATFLKAFESSGFETFWLSVQERLIAWPDARHTAFEPGARDREALMPMFRRALSMPGQRKLIVLHANNAHYPYGTRYHPARAPFPVDRSKVDDKMPSTATLDQWWNDYDNAIDETMAFLRDAVELLRTQEGESFLLFTPDHAENMLDDARFLSLHALKSPTLWDTAVPGLAWASDAWRRRQPAAWAMLQQNARRPLMHMDFTPTMLGAARIRYDEPRKEPVDLTAAPVPPRSRYTHLRAGQAVSLETLRQQAGLERPSPP